MKKLLFNDGWEFSEAPPTSENDIQNGTGADWSAVSIPHDWLIYTADDLYRSGIGCYRKSFIHSRKVGTRTYLRFDGVYMDCTVFVNGSEAGRHSYGYTGFELDITDLLVEGENSLLVRCVHLSPNSRWYSGAGIFRNVYLLTADERHIKSDGVYISCKKSADGFDAAVDTDTTCDGNIVHTVYAPDGSIAAQSEGGRSQRLKICSPVLWSVESPCLYKLETELYVGGELVDSCENSFGLRTIEITPDKGFFLNGRHMKLNGACMHHDLGCLGSAFNRHAARRQLESLREMGVNAVRTTHNPYANEYLELCDEMGILVVSECFDMWERPKTQYDYARFFADCHEEDVALWVRRDRNHPCVIMWSIGNEIYDTHADQRGLKITKTLAELVRRHDYMHNAFVTIGSNYMSWENAQKCSDEVEAAGYNYGEKLYSAQHEANPQRVIYGSETMSVVQSRGVYHFPLSQKMLTDDDEQCSALGNSVTSWGAKSIEQGITDDRDAQFSLGQFIWTGWDYIGEPTPYHTKNSYFGQIDTAGFPKDSFYIFKAEWNKAAEPFIHLFPYWDFNEGQLIDVRAATNASRAELFLNGRSLGVREIDHANGKKLLADWQVKYEAGCLEAVAYDCSGEVTAREEKHSFGDAARLVMTANRTQISAGSDELIFIEISALDKDGYAVENANNRIKVTVSGVGRLIGLDNGDSTDYDSYKGVSRRMFGGKLLAVIAARGESGEIYAEAASEGLQAAELTLFAAKGGSCEGMSTVYEENVGGEREEVPVRKLEIITEDGQTLDNERRTVRLRCVIHPENASYKDIEWRCTNAAGIDSNLARLTADGTPAEVSALGDGCFSVRCQTKNGEKGTDLYSQLEFTADGIGSLALNPYEFVSGGLYSLSGGEIGNGNERGFATSRDGVSWAAFENLDFGSFGPDEITVPVFCLDDAPLSIRIWDGVPEAVGSECVADVIYQKPSIWNVYQDETIKLSRRLSGIRTLAFRLERKAHIKGFSFAVQNRASEKLYAGECDSITGDSFTRSGKEITGIGNNVSISFDGMDFGAEGASSVTICGRTDMDICTIQLRITSEDGGESIKLAEFARSEDGTERSFDLGRISGKCDVAFVFLPGSRFDFSWFRFS